MTQATDLATLEQSAPTPAQYNQALSAAHEKAKLLSGIVEAQKLYTPIGSSKHLRFEAWITLAQGYGYDADIEWTRPIESGGWEARAVVRNSRGEVVGHAESECGTRGDSTWLDRPSFQQRSMAQTRALSKALASKLRWVVVLAGYNPTPFEEMASSELEVAGETYEGMKAWVMGGDGNGICPEHHLPFFQTAKMRSPAHKDGAGWCNRSDVLAPHFAELFQNRIIEMGLDPKADREAISNGIKSKYQTTWSGLSDTQKVEYLESLIPDAPAAPTESEEEK